MWFLSVLKMLAISVVCIRVSIGQDTFIQGHRGYTTMYLGNLNILISAPHGGTLKPNDIVDSFNSNKNDRETRLVAELVRHEISELFEDCTDGSTPAPFLIVNNLARTKMDPNIDECDECEELSLDALIAQADYHRLINEYFEKNFMSCSYYEQGLLIDIQSHDNPSEFFELGYLVNPKESNNNFQNSSVRLTASLDQSRGLIIDDLINGFGSLGGILQYKYNIKTLPSPRYNTTNETSYNPGGFILSNHGSRDCDEHRVNAIQIRIPSKALSEPWMNQRITAKVIGNAVYDFYTLHKFESQVLDQNPSKCI